MSAGEGPQGKICVVCHCDCTGRPRVKDPKGRYYCRSCYERVSGRHHADDPPRTAAAQRRPVQPPERPAAQPQSSEALALEDEGDLGLFARLPAAEREAMNAPVQQIPCPGCGKLVPAGAVLCVRCGYNRQLGTRMGSPEIVAASSGNGLSFGPLGGAGEMLLQPWLAGVLPGAGFLLLYMLASGSEDLRAVYLLAQGLFGLVVGIWVLIKAFGNSFLTGILCLCAPFYVLYFVFAGDNESPALKWATVASILSGALGYALGA